MLGPGECNTPPALGPRGELKTSPTTATRRRSRSSGSPGSAASASARVTRGQDDRNVATIQSCGLAGPDRARDECSVAIPIACARCHERGSEGPRSGALSAQRGDASPTSSCWRRRDCRSVENLCSDARGHRRTSRSRRLPAFYAALHGCFVLVERVELRVLTVQVHGRFKLERLNYDDRIVRCDEEYNNGRDSAHSVHSGGTRGA